MSNPIVRGGAAAAVMVVLTLALTGCVTAEGVAAGKVRDAVEVSRNYMEYSLANESDPGVGSVRELFSYDAIEGLTEQELSQTNLTSGGPDGHGWLYATDSDPLQAHLFHYASGSATTLVGGMYNGYAYACVTLTAEDSGEVRARTEDCPDWVLNGWPWNFGDNKVGL